MRFHPEDLQELKEFADESGISVPMLLREIGLERLRAARVGEVRAAS